MVDGRKVVLAIRPEHLIPDETGITATVRTVEWLGHERHVVCDVDGTPITIRETSEGPAPEVGAQIQVGAAPAHIHLFDPDSEERIA